MATKNNTLVISANTDRVLENTVTPESFWWDLAMAQEWMKSAADNDEYDLTDIEARRGAVAIARHLAGEALEAFGARAIVVFGASPMSANDHMAHAAKQYADGLAQKWSDILAEVERAHEQAYRAEVHAAILAAYDSDMADA
jgi:hypothetical protein